MTFTMEPITVDTINYCLKYRINRDKYSIDDDYFKRLFIDNPFVFRIIKIDGEVFGIVGFIPKDNYLLGYLILTDHYPKYAIFLIKEMRKVLQSFGCSVKFINHNDDNTIHRWYSLIGFKRIGDYWVKE